MSEQEAGQRAEVRPQDASGPDRWHPPMRDEDHAKLMTQDAVRALGRLERVLLGVALDDRGFVRSDLATVLRALCEVRPPSSEGSEPYAWAVEGVSDGTVSLYRIKSKAVRKASECGGELVPLHTHAGTSPSRGREGIEVHGWADAYDLRRMVEGPRDEFVVLPDAPDDSDGPSHEVPVTISYTPPAWAPVPLPAPPAGDTGGAE